MILKVQINFLKLNIKFCSVIVYHVIKDIHGQENLYLLHKLLQMIMFGNKEIT